jgi:hypothetical protein
MRRYALAGIELALLAELDFESRAATLHGVVLRFFGKALRTRSIMP